MNDTASDLSADLAQALSTFMDEAAELLAEMEAILLRATGLHESLPKAAEALGHRLDSEDARYAARELISTALYRQLLRAPRLVDCSRVIPN